MESDNMEYEQNIYLKKFWDKFGPPCPDTLARNKEIDVRFMILICSYCSKTYISDMEAPFQGCFETMFCTEECENNWLFEEWSDDENNNTVSTR